MGLAGWFLERFARLAVAGIASCHHDADKQDRCFAESCQKIQDAHMVECYQWVADGGILRCCLPTGTGYVEVHNGDVDRAH